MTESRPSARAGPFTRRAISILASALAIGAALITMWCVGAFPLPWNDELTFVSLGADVIRTGALLDRNAAFYGAGGVLTFPPLYALLVGGLASLLHLGIMGLRFAQGTAALLVLDRLVRSWWRSTRPGVAYAPGGVLLFAALGANPYFLRAAFFLRPDIVVLLAFLWVIGEVLTGRFLGSRARAIGCGAVLAGAALCHFSAVVLIPAYILGLLDAGARRGARAIVRPVVISAAAGVLFLSPYLVYLARHWSALTRFLAESHGAKYATAPQLGTYLWPFSLLIDRAARFEAEASGPRLTYAVWIAAVAALPLVALLAGRSKSAPFALRRAVVIWLAGSVGTWFAIRLWPEFWFTSLALVPLQAVIALSWPAREEAARKASFVWLAIHAVALLHLSAAEPIPSWSEYARSADAVARAIEPRIRTGRERVYLSSIPDFSTALLKRWPDLELIRGNDFPAFADAYVAKALSCDAFVVSQARSWLDHASRPKDVMFDYSGLLERAFEARWLEGEPVTTGIYRVWVLRPTPALR